MRSLNILHVVSIVAPSYGGSGIASLLMAQNQAKAGHKVAIYTTNVDFPSGTHIEPSNEPVIKNGVLIWHFSVQFRPFLVSIPFWMRLRGTIMSYDIIHIHGLYRFPVMSVALLARRVGVPYLIMPHGSLDPFLFNQSQHSLILKKISEKLLDFPNLNHAAAIHYTTKTEAERAALLGLRAKPIVVPNGIDWRIYKDIPLKGPFRRRLGLSDQTPLVLFLGRINFIKGLKLLVPAFSQVAQEYPNARLAIVGPDNEGYGAKVRRWCTEQRIEEKVLFLDYLEPVEVKQALVDADVFVLPSYTENFGLTVVEAMACKTPVVISDQVNICREVQTAGAGILVKLDPCALAKAISLILSDTSASQAMGDRGRDLAVKNYAWPSIVTQLTEIYQELIDERSSPAVYRSRYL